MNKQQFLKQASKSFVPAGHRPIGITGSVLHLINIYLIEDFYGWANAMFVENHYPNMFYTRKIHGCNYIVIYGLVDSWPNESECYSQLMEDLERASTNVLFSDQGYSNLVKATKKLHWDMWLLDAIVTKAQQCVTFGLDDDSIQYARNSGFERVHDLLDTKGYSVHFNGDIEDIWFHMTDLLT